MDNTRSRFFIISGSASGCLGCQNPAFGVGACCKKHFFADAGSFLISVQFLTFFCSFGCHGDKLDM